MMRRRLYFVLPNIRSAQAMMNELLLERVEESHIHFHAKNEQLLGNLPRANAVEKSDVVYSALAGFVFGAVFGLLGGLLAYLVPWWFGEVTLMVIPYCMVLGALSCTAWAAAVATAAPSYRLKSYQSQLEQGSITRKRCIVAFGQQNTSFFPKRGFLRVFMRASHAGLL
jgi:hypothetical protein